MWSPQAMGWTSTFHLTCSNIFPEFNPSHVVFINSVRRWKKRKKWRKRTSVWTSPPLANYLSWIETIRRNQKIAQYRPDKNDNNVVIYMIFTIRFLSRRLPYHQQRAFRRGNHLDPERLCMQVTYAFNDSIVRHRPRNFPKMTGMLLTDTVITHRTVIQVRKQKAARREKNGKRRERYSEEFHNPAILFW